MKAVNKILRFVVLFIVVLFVILCIASYLFGGHLLKVGIETAATKVLGVGVDIDDLDISIVKGTVEIEDLMVKNPPGYTYKNLLELGSGRVTVGIGSLLGDTVRIKELELDGIDLVIEQKALSNNLQDVISTIKSKEKKKAKDRAEPSAKKLRIDNLEISNIKVKVKLLPVPGKADTVTLNLTPIKMSNLGTDDKLSTGVLASKILVAIADGVAKEGVGVLPEEIVGKMKSTLGKTIGLGKTAAEEGEKLIKEGKDAGAEIIEGFKDLLKPKKEKTEDSTP